MSKIASEQKPLFEWSSDSIISENLSGFDNDPVFVALTEEIAEKFRLDPELAAIGTAWGIDWWESLQATPKHQRTVTYKLPNENGGYELAEYTLEEWSKEDVITARDSVITDISVPRDSTEGRPTFRVEFAAREALYLMAGPMGPDLRQMLEGKGGRIVPNFKKIDTVFATLLDSYERKLYPYNLDSTRVPQDPRHMPRNLETDIEKCDEKQKIQLASFWFADCYYMRGVNNSNDMTINLAKLYEDRPAIFDFNHAMTLDPKDVENLLLEYHLPVQHKQISKAWVENARRMVERYDGDPHRIFEDFGTYDELVTRVANDRKGSGFIGFQKKMASMLGYFYMTTGLIPYQNIPLPVDFHVMRMAISQELITFEDMASEVVEFEKTTDLLRAVTFDFADHHNISQLALCDVVWLYSRAACVNSPTNSMAIVGKRQGRKTVWQPTITAASDATPKQLEAYNQSCGVCRLKETCAHNVPSGRYYVSGEIWWPNGKIHLDHPQDDLHHSDTIEEAQRPVYAPTIGHAIDIRDKNREELAAKRIAAIRALSQSALFELGTDDEVRIVQTLVEANGNPSTSLSGKKFGFSDAEIETALGANPSPEELAAIQPYRASL